MSLNIYEDSRNRGLEVLLYQPDNYPKKLTNDKTRFKFKFQIPFIFNKVFHFKFETYIEDKLNHSEQN